MNDERTGESEADPTAETVHAHTPIVALTPMSKLHDAAQQARLLRGPLQDGKQRTGFLLGAGCPGGVYNAGGTESSKLIPAVVELTKRVRDGLAKEKERNGDGCTFSHNWDILAAECKDSTERDPTVEDILTELRTLANRRGSAPVSGLAKSDLISLDRKICEIILAEMKKSLPLHRCSYHRFAAWIGGIQRQNPVEVFTPNYDLLFEQAFEQHPLPHFDGFVGSHQPYFDIASIEHDAIPPRWTRLWKLHGSINWEELNEKVNGKDVKRVVRVSKEADASRVMVYPSHLKYDQSRRMPYLAMLDRLRAFFRVDQTRKESSPPFLAICGYSFLDDHLNEVLLDGLRGNGRAHCWALMFGRLDDCAPAVAHAEKLHNLTLLARDGAVVGSRTGLYRDGTTGGSEHFPWLYEEDFIPADGSSVEKNTRSHLGDFHYFTLFLEQLYGGRSEAEHAAVRP